MAVPTSPLNKAIALASDLKKRTLFPGGELPGGDPTPGVSPFFFDDFDAGNLSKTGNGFSWSQAVAGDVQVTTENPRTGTHSIAFTYGPNADGLDDTAELSYLLGQTAGQGYQEVWFEYYWYVPSNYIHRFQGNEHHKFFAIYSDAQDNGGAQAIFENWRTNDTQSFFRAICIGGSCDVPSYYPDFDNNRPFIIPSILGTWVRVRIHIRLGQDPNGLIEVWRDNTKVYHKVGPQWTGNGDFLRRGYLMGWSNAGYTNQTRFFIDNFKVWATDPQWSFA